MDQTDEFVASLLIVRQAASITGIGGEPHNCFYVICHLISLN